MLESFHGAFGGVGQNPVPVDAGWILAPGSRISHSVNSVMLQAQRGSVSIC